MNSENLEKQGKDPERKWYSINMKLLPLKIHFFTLNAAISSFQPYLPLHVKNVGLSVTAVGFLYTAVSVVALVAKPFFGWVADKYRREKLLAASMLLTSIVFYLVIAFIPSIDEIHNVELQLHCNSSQRQIKRLNETCLPGPNRVNPCLLQCTNCSSSDKESSKCGNTNLRYENISVLFSNPSVDTTFTIMNESEIECSEMSNSNCVLICVCDEWCCSPVNEYHTLVFWILFISFIFVGIGERVLRSLTDSICYIMLRCQAKNYGRQRLWVAVGTFVAPALTGYLLDITKQGNLYNYAVAVFVLVAFMATDILFVGLLDLGADKNREKSNNVCKDVAALAMKSEHLFCAATTVVGGMANGIDIIYYFIFMAEVGASKTLIGISVGCCLLTQLPVMFFSGELIRKIGHFNTFGISLAATGVRFLIFSYIYNPLWVLLPQVLFRPGIDLFIVCLASYANAVAPPGTKSTLQQVASSLYGGIGIGLGYSLGGLSFDHYGSRKTLLILFIIITVTALMNFVFGNRHKFSCKKNIGEVEESVPVDLSERPKEDTPSDCN